MTSPDEPTNSEVERVPLKVVPLYVEPLPDETDETEPELVVEDEGEDLASARSARTRTPLVGIAAAVFALGTIGVHIAAIVVSSAGDFVLGAQLGWIAIGLSALALVVGLVAAIFGLGRAWGITAAVVAVLANPYVLLFVLTALSALQTA